MKNYDGWALVHPNGTLDAETFGYSKDDCWGRAFGVIAIPGFQSKYWKRWDASIRAAKKAGYQIVKVKLERVKS